MSWQDRLKKAQWRGQDFLTEQHDAREGQRLVVHELPGRDLPVVEDLGAKAPTYKVSAYFVGPDYDRARDQFLDKLRQPGPAWLEHPWLGQVWVRAQDWSISESNAEGGMCKVSVDFAPGGGDVPRPQVDLSDIAKTRADGYVVTGSDFSPKSMPLDGYTAFMRQVNAGMDGLRTALTRARMPLTMAAQVLAAVDSAKALLADALSLPGTYASALRSISGALGLAMVDGFGGSTSTSASTTTIVGTGTSAGVLSSLDTPDDVVRLRVVAALCQAAQPVVLADDASSPVSATTAAALQANLVAEQSARGHWLVATAMQVALADYTVAEVRDAVLVQVLRALDAVLPLADDAVFESAVQARAALQQVLLAQDLTPTQERRLAAPVPSVVLAYRMGVDESVLVARNVVRHPLFVRGVVRV